MTAIDGARGIFVRDGEAEVLELPNNVTKLFAEGASTGGAFSAIRASLQPGADGARPHHHAKASELFFVIDGCVDILIGDDVVTVRAGDLAVAAPLAMHAFANGSATEPADLLIVFGPAIERFDYFRLLRDVVAGKATIADVLASQERFDNWFSENDAWNAHRESRRAASGRGGGRYSGFDFRCDSTSSATRSGASCTSQWPASSSSTRYGPLMYSGARSTDMRLM